MSGRMERRRATQMMALDYGHAEAAARIGLQAGFAEKLLHALLIAHGGAMIGLFTFIGNMVGQARSPFPLSTGWLWLAFACFVAGLSVTLAAHISAFLSQQYFYFQSVLEVRLIERSIEADDQVTDRDDEIRHNRTGLRHYIAGLAMAFSSIVLFATGCGLALAGLLPR